jgi:transposase
MNKQTRRTFSAEFKLEAASLITEQRYSVREASQAMNVSRSTLARWLQQLRSEQQRLSPKAKPITSEQ